MSELWREGPHIAIKLAVLWNGTFHASSSTTCRDESNWSYCSLYGLFLCTNKAFRKWPWFNFVFLWDKVCAELAQHPAETFGLHSASKETPDSHQDFSYSLPEYNQELKLGSAFQKKLLSPTDCSTAIGFWSVSGFVGSCVIGDFSMLKDFLLFLLHCFFSRSTKGSMKDTNGWVVISSTNFEINLGTPDASPKDLIGLNRFLKRNSAPSMYQDAPRMITYLPIKNLRIFFTVLLSTDCSN